MISEGAYGSVILVMRYGCYLKIFPYHWDPIKGHLTPMTKWYEKSIHAFHQLMSYALATFAGIRLLLAVTGKADFPARVMAMNILWALAYALTAISFIQFSHKRDQIANFGNSFFDALRQSMQHIEKVKETRKSVYAKTSTEKFYMSKIIVLSGIMLAINPPFHSIMMIDTPCAPHFSSSVWLKCDHVEEDSHSILEKIPFIFLETYFAVLIFTPWTFNWTLIYLGLGWLRLELEKMKEMLGQGQTRLLDLRIYNEYHSIKVITILINESFEYYLRWFPTILLGIVSFLLYSCIRFWDVGWRAYGMFPSCFVRCSFEAFTPLALAGNVNQSCISILQKWKTGSWSQGQRRHESETHLLKALQKSCKKIECSAGGMYVFENSIVLTTINNCLLLTLNLLLVRSFN